MALLKKFRGFVNGSVWEREDIDAIRHFVSKILLSALLPVHDDSCPVLVFSSSNNPASLTSRLGATIDVEQNLVRFLGDLVLNLWDCGGQDSFMDSYLSTQRATIFQNVGVLIYVFDVESREMNKDLEYYRDCLDALRKYSPDAVVFLLVHKMDLVRQKAPILERKTKDLRDNSGETPITVFGTSIYDESLYKVRNLLVRRPANLLSEFRLGRESYIP